MKPIVMDEGFWRNSQLSIAHITGRVSVNGFEYVIVDKRGHDIFECSLEAEKEGRKMAIEPGEPVDLCRTDFVPIYRELGRERFLAFLKECPWVNTPAAARSALKRWAAQKSE